MLRLRSVAAVLAVFYTASSANSHEFWIDVRDYQIDQSSRIEADLKVGQMFSGARSSYFPQHFIRFDLGFGDQIHPVEGRLGDIPAANVTALGDGLHVLVHQTSVTVLTYPDMEKFSNFVTHKDAAEVLERHAARGLPQEKFKEAYSRYAKALVKVGSGAGADKDFGLETEITALKNPYTDDLTDGIPVRVTYQGAPRTNAQVEIFSRDSNGVAEVSLGRTDGEGIAVIPVVPGRDYMIDAVVLREPSPELAAEKGAVWESLWANLTFHVAE